MDEENKSREIDYYLEPPRDIYEIYMRQRREMANCVTFMSLYSSLLSLIVNGCQLLPDNYSDEREDVLSAIEGKTLYPDKAPIEENNGFYMLGNESTGRIVVRHEDIKEGKSEAKEQMATAILPRLMGLDSRILTILTTEGIIAKKQSTFEGQLMEGIDKELREAVRLKAMEVKRNARPPVK
jgi:hypothetical protein